MLFFTSTLLTKILYAFLIAPVRTTFPANLIHLNLISLITWPRTQITKLLFLQISPAFLLPTSGMHMQTSFRNILSTQTGSNSSTIAADSSNGVTNRGAVNTVYALLMMGGSTTRNM
jgi:hypothetical protein